MLVVVLKQHSIQGGHCVFKSITDQSVLPYPFSRRTIDFGDPAFEVVRVAPRQLLQHSDQGKQCYDLYTELYQYCLNS